MTIHPKIQSACNDWKIDPRIIQAMYLAEGGTEATFIKATSISVPSVHTFESAVDVACRSVCHRMNDYIVVDNNRLKQFITVLGSHWAPLGVNNDPTNLNKNWIPNVLRFLGVS